MSTSIRIAVIAAAGLLAVACSKPPTPPPAPTTATAYEAVLIPGTQYGAARLNVSTGQTVIAWGAPAQMQSIPDLTLPASHYHLVLTDHIAGDNTVSWTLMRADVATGRIWMLTGGVGTYAWIELTPPK